MTPINNQTFRRPVGKFSISIVLIPGALNKFSFATHESTDDKLAELVSPSAMYQVRIFDVTGRFEVCAECASATTQSINDFLRRTQIAATVQAIMTGRLDIKMPRADFVRAHFSEFERAYLYSTYPAMGSAMGVAGSIESSGRREAAKVSDVLPGLDEIAGSDRVYKF